MISKDEVLNAIMKITGGDSSKEFTKNKILEIIGKSKKGVDQILDDLIKEGKIRLSRTAGRAKYYVLSNREQEPRKIEYNTDIIKNALREVLEEFFGKPKTYDDLDKVYEIVKDDLGYATIKDLREQLGMTLEQFMGKFRDYILKNYELISGGKEGIVIKGVMYGIIRKKV
ncbi:hypothetical protein [Saccharolobus caldissimus]|uniref:Uncharacterized protein n=1 Tax=Saccharolobus caldissimus TaxID=1702097 RepID=A0AAQ4CUT0_9CREN|nr:hypothetical protein [Saccharolobus caldissimus]BDB99561.1 hypothetical protein SACC_25780 [Saccharolobus caldissimus]